MDNTAKPTARKRGGAKREPGHMLMLAVSTALLILAGIFLIIDDEAPGMWSFLGIITMAAGIGVRYFDVRR